MSLLDTGIDSITRVLIVAMASFGYPTLTMNIAAGFECIAPDDKPELFSIQTYSWHTDAERTIE